MSETVPGHADLVYRPNKHDDWGFIRYAATGDLFAVVRPPLGEDEAAKHRRNGTDPFEPLARTLMAALSTPIAAHGAGAVTVDALAQEIRRVDGNHNLGAGALAEALMPFLAALRPDEAAGQGEAKWTSRIKGSAKIHSHPLVEDGIVENSYGIKFRGEYYGSVEKAKEVALATPRPEASDAPDIVDGEYCLRLNGRDIYECANQLAGYVDPSTPERLAQFLLRESKAASDLADALAALRAERDMLWHYKNSATILKQDLEAAEAEVARLKDENKELVAGLEPFAAWPVGEAYDDTDCVGDFPFTAGQFRRARSLTAAKGG